MNARNPQQAIPPRWRTALLVVLLLWSSAAAAINNCPCPAEQMAEEPPTVTTMAPVPDCHHDNRRDTDRSPSTSDAASFADCCPELALTPSRTRIDDPPKSPTVDTLDLAVAAVWPHPRNLAAARTHLQRDPPHLQLSVPAYVLLCCFRE